MAGKSKARIEEEKINLVNVKAHVAQDCTRNMEKYLVRVPPPNLAPEIPNPNSNPSRRRRGWERNLAELRGRLGPKYKHQLSSLLVESYTQVGAIPHSYYVEQGLPCQTHVLQACSETAIKQGITSLEFDNKGVYLVSVTKTGCLTVHDFETLCSHITDKLPSTQKEEDKPVLHLSLGLQLDAVRWNPLNQDEVACISRKSNEVLIFDIGYISSEPIEVLRSRRDVTVHGSEIHKGLTDMAFFTIDKSRLIASDTSGAVIVWDRRMSSLPCLQLTTNLQSTLNSIQLHTENQMVFGAGRSGIVHAWDLRGGRTSSSLQHHKEVCYPPVTSCKLASMLERISSLKAQAAIVSREVHAINFNPSCPYQLAFHLDDGWSGVLDIFNSEVTHIHCPPPAWLNCTDISVYNLCLRKPSWLHPHSHYIVGSASEKGVHLLDFYPDPSSPCHVDYSEEAQKDSRKPNQIRRNKFLPLSESVTACTTHPVTDTIIAGSKRSSLLVISQPKQCDPDIASE